jgi:hypothetical protein
MKKWSILFCVLVVVSAGSLTEAVAGNVDKYIKQLQSSDAKERADAAYELSCG